MKYKLIKLLLLLITPFLMISCLDIVEEIDLNQDKSGTATYTFNFSQSKLKINTVRKLDSIGGHKIPKLYEVERKIDLAVNEISSKEGIIDANYKIDESEYIYVLEVQFKSLNALNAAIKSMSYWKNSSWKPNSDFYNINNNIIVKRGEVIEVPSNRKADLEKQKESLKLGKYVFVLRNPEIMKLIIPSELKLSGNKKAVMFRSNLYDLINRENELNLKVVSD